MFFVIGHVIGKLSFTNLARYARNDTRTYFLVGGTNYCIAMCAAIIWALLSRGEIVFEWPAILLGAYEGFQYQIMFIVLFATISLGGMAVASTINHFSIIVPVIASMVLWGEVPPTARIIGTVVILISMPLVGLDAQRRARSRGMSSFAFPALMAVSFVMLGTGQLAAKAFVELRVDSAPGDYAVFLFAAATLSTLLTWPLVVRLANREIASDKIKWRKLQSANRRLAIFVGIMLGLSNFVQNILLVEALAILPATLIFPLTAASFLLLVTLADIVIWKQKFSSATVTGIGLAGLGLVLINI